MILLVLMFLGNLNKMNILLIDIDNNNRKGKKHFPNLAIHKLAKYYELQGANVIWNNDLFCNWADKIFVSCVFGWNREKAQEYEKYPQAIIGGSGYNFNVLLLDEIEKVNPMLNIGFTSRGCIRNCPFCIVPQKEGKIKAVADVYNIWDGKNRDIILLDNNILALPEHFFKICSQIKKEKLRIDFNQGLDCRLMTPEIAKCLKEMRHNKYRFSWDNMSEEKNVLRCIKILQDAGINDVIWYVLVNFDTTPEQDLYRLNLLKSLNQRCFVQRYNLQSNPFYTVLAQWSNQHQFFRAMDFEMFLKYPHYKNAREWILKNYSKQEV